MIHALPARWRTTSVLLLIAILAVMADIVWGEGCNKAF